jgi:hypothetical protein
MMNLRTRCLNFFKSFLADAGCTFDEDGTIRIFERTSSGGVKHPKLKIESLDVVLPLKEQLDKPEGENVIFSPLNENVLAGESAVITALKRVTNSNIQYRLSVVLITLATVMTAKKTIKGPLLKIIKAAPEFNNTSKTELIKLLSRSSRLPITRNSIGIYLTHKNQKFEGLDVKRLATVNSPLVNALLTEDTPWGVKCAKIHKDSIVALIEAVLPGIEDDMYTHGSNSVTSPYFDALANAFRKVSERLGYVEEMLREYQDEVVLVTLPAPATGTWAEELADIIPISKAFPAYAGNNGNCPTGKEVSTTTSTAGIKVDEAFSPSSQGTGFGQPATPVVTSGVKDEWASTPVQTKSNTFASGNAGLGFGQPTNSGFGQTQNTGFGQPTNSGFGNATGGNNSDWI